MWFDDRGAFQRADSPEYIGGQGLWGEDQVVADEQSAAGTYVRSDLSTAYNRGGDPADQRGRKLVHFYRSVLYLRAANLFVVYDQARATPSDNRDGPYAMHLRWHVPTRPVVSGATVRVDQGAARLYLTTLLAHHGRSISPRARRRRCSATTMTPLAFTPTSWSHSTKGLPRGAHRLRLAGPFDGIGPRYRQGKLLDNVKGGKMWVKCG